MRSWRVPLAAFTVWCLGVSRAQTDSPTAIPTASPTAVPTAQPSERPTAAPTDAPTLTPTAAPTAAPSTPTAVPTTPPTALTSSPSAAPTPAGVTSSANDDEKTIFEGGSKFTVFSILLVAVVSVILLGVCCYCVRCCRAKEKEVDDDEELGDLFNEDLGRLKSQSHGATMIANFRSPRRAKNSEDKTTMTFAFEEDGNAEQGLAKAPSLDEPIPEAKVPMADVGSFNPGHIGTRILYKGKFASDGSSQVRKVPGKIRFVGYHHKHKLARVGIELDEPLGKNNGRIGTALYFECPDNHGVLAVPANVEFADGRKRGTTIMHKPKEKKKKPRPAKLPEKVDYGVPQEFTNPTGPSRTKGRHKVSMMFGRRGNTPASSPPVLNPVSEALPRSESAHKSIQTSANPTFAVTAGASSRMSNVSSPMFLPGVSNSRHNSNSGDAFAVASHIKPSKRRTSDEDVGHGLMSGPATKGPLSTTKASGRAVKETKTTASQRSTGSAAPAPKQKKRGRRASEPLAPLNAPSMKVPAPPPRPNRPVSEHAPKTRRATQSSSTQPKSPPSPSAPVTPRRASGPPEGFFQVSETSPVYAMASEGISPRAW